jgi:hypothetical protein
LVDRLYVTPNQTDSADPPPGLIHVADQEPNDLVEIAIPMILQEAFPLGTAWLREANPGICRSWEDLAFLRANWDGPIVLKGIQAVEDAHAVMDAHMDGIVV